MFSTRHFIAVLLAGAVCLPACGERGESTGKTGAKDPHAGHDHGHDHDHDHGKAEKDEHDHAKGEKHDHAEGDECCDEEAEGGHDHADEVVLTADAVKNAGIRVEKTAKRVLHETVAAPARVSFNLEKVAHVGSPLSGRVIEIKARLGDEVKKGGTLLTIDSPDLGEAQSDYLQKRTAVATAEPSIELAKASYERAKKLYDENGGIALNEVQKREADVKAAQGGLASAKAALKAAENRLTLLGMSGAAVEALGKTSELKPRFTIVAPLDGRVVAREVTVGELVGPDRETLLTLADTASLWVIADVPEAKVAGVRVGNKASVASPTSGDAVEGAVTHIAAVIDSAKRTAEVRIEVQGRHALKPGMFVQAQVETSTAAAGEAGAPGVLAVPQSAIQTVEGETSVFIAVPGEPNTFAKRAVKLGRGVGAWLPVLEGLKEGDEVVVAGSFTLKADLGKAGAAHEH